MKISVIGTGYVGLTTGVCFAEIGHSVICVDNDKAKIALLKKNRKIPIYEPGLEEILKKNVQNKRLSFSTDIKEAVKKSDVIFISVGTPPREDGSADLSYIENVASEIAKSMDGYKLIVDKSTVPVETGEKVEMTIKRNLKKNIPFDVASNPEFLREGSAVYDTFNPDRVVIGVSSKKAENILREIYKPLNTKILVTDIKSAEIIKHASNSFLAAKISFINAVANICERCGADVEKVAEGMGLDKRIGSAFLHSGIGFGGFCFPKDLEAFLWISEKLGYQFDLLKNVREINEYQKRIFIKKIEDALWVIKGKTIGILGLAFKPNTDDMRFAPSIDIIKTLQNEGAKIKAFDPEATEKAKDVLKNIVYCKNPYEVAKDADCLAILTEWDEIKKVDLKKIKKLLRHPIIIDGRNIFEPKQMEKLGFIYKGIGR
ncbi:MAG: UDP-glucose 6-dehydrogenase [Elusimicrobia bacterium CG06_land_8_20_14_3_00_38_11]|nr:MAG: UDP-glucose 6-dehydrogenase [Elusimicrobia bacterium CG06_land_8_20_14_3_00_38_11]